MFKNCSRAIINRGFVTPTRVLPGMLNATAYSEGMVTTDGGTLWFVYVDHVVVWASDRHGLLGLQKVFLERPLAGFAMNGGWCNCVILADRLLVAEYIYIYYITTAARMRPASCAKYATDNQKCTTVVVNSSVPVNCVRLSFSAGLPLPPLLSAITLRSGDLGLHACNFRGQTSSTTNTDMRALDTGTYVKLQFHKNPNGAATSSSKFKRSRQPRGTVYWRTAKPLDPCKKRLFQRFWRGTHVLYSHNHSFNRRFCLW